MAVTSPAGFSLFFVVASRNVAISVAALFGEARGSK
jgi:hypothetical protein